jgi:hypothetical protein
MNDPEAKLTELRQQFEQLQRENAALRSALDRKEEAIRQLFEEFGMAITPEDVSSAVPGEPWMAEFLRDLESGKLAS